MKKYVGLFFVSLLLLTACFRSQTAIDTNQPINGRVVFGISDAATEMNGVSSMTMTVDKVQVYNQASGWVTVSSQPKDYDLLKLKAEGKSQVMADTKIPRGSYDKVKLTISKVVVTNSNGTYEAKMPSSEFRTDSRIDVDAKSTSTASFDFMADQSLHLASDGQYVVAPVAKVETRYNSNVDVDSSGYLSITGGTVQSSSTIGMDINGNVGVGLGIASDANISINGGVISIGNAQANSTTGIGVTI
ncbi:MAG: DUF4382 domain-containing protein [Nanoarchaeota archaeon]|nr:MAG: DUF4382 domain-containing protein [Nanoarchaeota archaeon]